MHPSGFVTGCREVAYSLRAQGHTLQEIEDLLRLRFQGERTPDFRTIARWLSDPEGRALVADEEKRIRAIAATQSAELVPLAYDGIRAALQAGDLKGADAGSRVIVNLTRGFIREQIEVTPPKALQGDDELRELLKAHGVVLDATQQKPPNA